MVRANFRGATASPQVEQEAPADEAYLAFQEVLERIEQGFETGDLSEDEADELEAAALADYQDILADELGIEVDEEYDDEDEDGADYSGGTELATFSSGSQLGSAVLEMGQGAGYETVEDLIYDLSDTTGFDPEDLADLISGNASVEDFHDPELAAHTLATAFPSIAENEEAYEGFMQMAAEEAGYEVDGEAGEDSVDYSRYRLDLERDSRLNRMEAEFAAAQEASAIQTELFDLTREADLGFQEGWLPPAAYKAIIGEFELDTDRFAAFSAVCDSNEVPAETELYAMRKQLEVFRRCGPFVKFGATVEEDLDPDELQELKQVKASTNAYAKRINQYVGE